MEKIKKYDTCIIVDEKATQEEVEKIFEKIDSIAKIENVKINEVKKLAYPIKKKEQALYIALDIAGTDEKITELEKFYRLENLIYKYITIRISE